MSSDSENELPLASLSKKLTPSSPRKEMNGGTKSCDPGHLMARRRSSLRIRRSSSISIRSAKSNGSKNSQQREGVSKGRTQMKRRLSDISSTDHEDDISLGDDSEFEEPKKPENRAKKQKLLKASDVKRNEKMGPLSTAKASPKTKPRPKPKSKAKPKAKPKGKSKAVKRKASIKKVKKENSEASDEPDSKVKVNMKALPPLKKLELAMKSHKWWEHEADLKGEMKWNNLEHHGVMFPPFYDPLPAHIKLSYDKAPVDLTVEQEELAFLYAGVPVEGPQLGDPATAKVFNKNFFADFKKVLGKGHKIKQFDKCDFSKIRAHILEKREEKKNKTKEEKEVIKAEKDQQKIVYTFAFVDGNVQKVGNVMVEPPGLFRGRGAHPKTGTLKHWVNPEQITLNIGEDAPVPPCSIPGHSWSGLVHKHEVTWLAYWKENVMDNTKYVWLAASSGFKGKADREKYEKARRLKNCIGKIRSDYELNLKNREIRIKQRATAMWVIDRLALRVGNEKDEDEADTVGCCSLRVEHIVTDPDAMTLTLDFLGKDSMRHFQTYKLEAKYGEIGKLVLKNFEAFCKNKKPADQVFDRLDVLKLNDHLKLLMPGLSAKVFRTFNASSTLEEQLPLKIDEHATAQEKMVLYNAANRKVAILCNHQRTVSKAAESSLEKLEETIKMLEKQHKELKDMLRKRKKEKLVKLKDEDIESKEKKKEQAHLFTKQPSVDQVKKRIQMWDRKIETQQLNLKNKNDNKTVALGTSKINYCDPRISVAWAKRNEVPIEKIFPQALRDKFPWAMSETIDFRF